MKFQEHQLMLNQGRPIIFEIFYSFTVSDFVQLRFIKLYGFLYTKIVWNILEPFSDDLYKIALRERMNLLLCPKTENGYEQSGCNTDCISNHGGKFGTCKLDTPIDGGKRDLYCVCDHSK